MKIVLFRRELLKSFPYLKCLSGIKKYKLHIQFSHFPGKTILEAQEGSFSGKILDNKLFSPEDFGAAIFIIQRIDCGLRLEYRFQERCDIYNLPISEDKELCCPLGVLHEMLTAKEYRELTIKYIRTEQKWRFYRIPYIGKFEITEKLESIKKIQPRKIISHVKVNGKDFLSMLEALSGISYPCSSRKDILLKSTYICINKNGIKMETTNGGVFAEVFLPVNGKIEGKSSSIVVLSKHLQILARILENTFLQVKSLSSCDPDIDIYLTNKYSVFEIHKRFRSFLVLMERSGKFFYSIFDKIKVLPKKEIIFRQEDKAGFFRAIKKAPSTTPDMGFVLSYKQEHDQLQYDRIILKSKYSVKEETDYISPCYPLKSIPKYMQYNNLKNSRIFLCGNSNLLLISANNIQYALIPQKDE